MLQLLRSQRNGADGLPTEPQPWRPLEKSNASYCSPSLSFTEISIIDLTASGFADPGAKKVLSHEATKARTRVGFTDLMSHPTSRQIIESELTAAHRQGVGPSTEEPAKLAG